MYANSPVQTLSDAIGAALHRDLNPHVIKDRNGVERAQRPNIMDVSISMFIQGWGSTTLGYGGVGGQSLSSAYTVIVKDEMQEEYCVYFGGSRLAYRINFHDLTQQGKEDFLNDIRSQEMASCSECFKRYQRKPTIREA